jgi:autotransporter-associated beta strand protein
MNLLSALSGKVLGRRSRRRRRKPEVASRLGLGRSLHLEPLEQRRLLTINIPLLNSDFQSPMWVQSGSSWVQQTVAPGTQPWNSNNLDPRFGPPGWAKTAQGGGGPGPNGEGIYSEANDLGIGHYFDYVNGQLPAPASGVNFFCLQPAPGGTYNFWVDQQPDTTGDAGNHNDLNYPPMIAATIAQTGETYQATVALGNPLVNSGDSFPDVELDITLGAGTYYEPSNTNSYNYVTDSTNAPQPGDSSIDYDGYGTTVASAFTTGWQVTPGTFQNLSVTWTCPPQDNGQPLDVMIVYHGVSQTTCMSNLQLNDITALPTAPTGLVAAGASTSQVNLSWSDNATNVSGFQIDQSTSPDFSTGVTTAAVSFPTTTYSATGLSAGTTYYYRIRAFNGAGDSVNSSTVSAATGLSGTPVAVTVPDGNFASDATGDYIDASGANGGNGTFTQSMTGTLAGWSLSATPSTANGGYYSWGGWDPFGVLDSVSSSGASPYSVNAAGLGNQPGSTYNAFVYYPGEQYADNGVVVGPQPGASLTMTTTGINETAVAGNTYTATIQYANVSGSNAAVNPSANIEFNILANGVVVSSAGLSGLAQGSPWTPATVGWVADAAHAGEEIQLQVVATNFLEGPSSTQQWEVPTFALANAALTDTAPAGNPPAAPSSLTATAASSSQINLSWTDSANDESGFQIDRSTSSNFAQNLISVTTSGTTTSYSDTSASPNTTYYYRVWAINGGTISTAPSNTASATTPASVSISIPNYSFENPAQANGGYSNNSITNWTIGSDATNDTAGVQNNTGASYVNSVPDGAQFAYVNADSNSSGYPSSNSLTSAVLATVSGGEVYTLTVAVGNRADAPYADNGTYTISLLDGGTVLASQTYAGSSITPGAWHYLSLGFTTPGNVAAGNLQVQLVFATAGYAAGNAFGQGEFDDIQLTASAANTPAAPSGLTATAASASEIDLSWANNASNQTGFQIDQATSSDFTQNLTTVTVGANATTYAATGLSSGTTYYYRVRAINANGVSANSATAGATTAVTIPAAPSGLTATAASSSEIDLSWTNNATNQTGFQIDQATSSDFTQNLITVTVGANATTYAATGLALGTTYYYQVRATNSAGNSANSSPASATTETTAAISVPDAGFEQATVGQITNDPSGTLTAPVTATIPGWNLTITPTTYDGGTYNGYAPFAQIFTSDPSSGDYMASDEGNQHLSFNGGELFNNYPWVFGWPGYGIIPGQTDQVASAASLATSVAGATYTATIAVADPLWQTVDHQTFAQEVAAAAYEGNPTAAQVAASGVWIATPQFQLNIVANGQIVGSATLAAATQASTEAGTAVAAGQWYTLTATWVAPASGESISLQAIASQIAEGAYNLGHSITSAEGPDLFTSTCASFDDATLTVSTPIGTPAAPSGLMATAASSSEIDLSWTNNATNQTGFQIDQATSSDFSQNLTTVTVGANATSYRATGLAAGTAYYYRVHAINGNGQSADTATASATTQSTTPIAPSGLTATAASSSEINLSWTNNATNQTGFQIDQATSSDFTQNLTTVTVGANATTYSAMGLSAGTTYYYQVRAVNSNGNSANSSPASATTLATIPVAPSGLTATAISGSQINLSWTNNATNQTGFQIDQATSSDFTQNLTTVTVGANVTSFSAMGLSSTTTYYYRVRAFNSAGDSSNTSTASATTSAVVITAISVPDGDFASDATGFYLTSGSGGGFTFTSPLTATLSGWTVSADPSTANGGYYASGGWEPYGVLDTVTSGSGATPYPYLSVATIGGQPASTYNAFLYFPGEMYNDGSVVGGAQPGASLTMTTTGITATAAAGSTYTATIQYANVSQSNAAANPSANVALNILANGVVVGTGTLSGLAQDSPWTAVTATWTADAGHAGQAIQIQVVATNFLEGPGSTQQWQVPTFGFADAALSVAVPVTAPAAPTGLVAEAVSSSQINLSWTSNSNNQTGFQIDQATDPGFTQNLTTVTLGANATSYSATGLSSNTAYFYRVRATNSAGSSANTATASALTSVTTAVIPVPDGNFAADAANYYLTSATGPGTFTAPLTTTLSGWAISAVPSTASGGNYAAYEPYGVLDTVTSGSGATPFPYLSVATIGNQPSSPYNAFIYYPGELYNYGSVVGGAQPGASLTMTTTGIMATVAAGSIYTATIQYANVSQSNAAVNPSANVALNILANGVVVGTGTLSGLVQNSPWTTVTATWTAGAAYAGQAIQLQVVATNFLEGPGSTQQWQVPTFGFADATLTRVATVIQALTSISLAGQPLRATAYDQFGNPMATQPAFDAGTNTITSPLALTGNVTVLAAAGSQLTISGGISGTGPLTVSGPGTVVLSGADNYTGGTQVTAGALVVDNASAIAAGTNLTVGAGAAAFFGPVSQITYAPAVTAGASSAVATAATPAVASPVHSNSSAVLAASTAGVGAVVNDLAPRHAIANWQPRQSAPAGPLYAPAADRLPGSSTVKRIAADLAWLTIAAGNSDSSDQDRRKDAAVLALDAAFAHYDQ